jgi:nucleotide-binding universal stress UspA family protein
MKTIIAQNEHERGSSPETSALGVSVAVKTILVPLDFSRTAMRALDYATALATGLNAKIHLMHVQRPDEACAVPNAGHLMRECAESISFLHERPDHLEADRPPQFWSENCHIQTGRPDEEICRLARELNIGLIILGSRGNSGLKRVVLGSTAERVVRFSPCPVLVVRRRKRKFKIGKILAPVDFSECSMAGAVYAAFLAKTFDAKLCLFHVVERPPPPVLVDRVSSPFSERELTIANARLEMEALSKLGFLSDAKCAVDVRTGWPVDEICGQASQADVDLVVISTHGRTGFNRILLGSVAEQVVRYADCPVLVVPSRNSHS